MNNCLKSNIIVLAVTLLGTSLFVDGTDKQIASLQAQNNAMQQAFNEILAKTIDKHEKATDALEIAERAVSAKRNELEFLKKSLESQKGKDCR
jgi:hypothetical protein